MFYNYLLACFSLATSTYLEISSRFLVLFIETLVAFKLHGFESQSQSRSRMESTMESWKSRRTRFESPKRQQQGAGNRVEVED